MQRDDFFCLGKILKPHGNKGHLVVFFDVDDPWRYENITSVFVGIEHEQIPFLVDSIEIQDKGRVILRFEDIHSISDAEPFAGRAIFLPVSMLPPLKGKKFYFHEITGFAVHDEARGYIGEVRSVIELPSHPLLQVLNGNKEILIPLTEETLKKVDRRKKEIRVETPEGLIDLYI
jgi:16S rRNA processing protein RimM